MNKRLKIFLLLAASFITGVRAQTVFKEVPEFAFASFTQNKLSFPGDSQNFQFLFRKLDTLFLEGRGSIHIVHFGGSHIQADIISDRFRTNLASFQPGVIGARGYVFPYSIGKTNNPYTYITAYKGSWAFSRNVKPNGDIPLGMAGVAVATTDSIAEVSIHLRNSLNISYDFNRIRILSSAVQYDSLVFIRLTDSTGIYPQVDSCTHSYVFFLPSYTDSFRICFKQPDTLQFTHIVRGFLLENDFQGISYHSMGVNGAAVPSYLRCPMLGDDLRLIKPDLVIFSVGINDASAPAFDVNSFKRNYKQLLRILKEAAPDCAILFTTNNDSYKRYRRRYLVNPAGPIVSKAFMDLGREYGAAVWDMFTIMGGLESMSQWEKAGLAKHDKVHFTPFGYNVLGDLLYNAFIESYLNHLNSTYTSSKN